MRSELWQLESTGERCRMLQQRNGTSLRTCEISVRNIMAKTETPKLSRIWRDVSVVYKLCIWIFFCKGIANLMWKFKENNFTLPIEYSISVRSQFGKQILNIYKELKRRCDETLSLFKRVCNIQSGELDEVRHFKVLERKCSFKCEFVFSNYILP